MKDSESYGPSEDDLEMSDIRPVTTLSACSFFWLNTYTTQDDKKGNVCEEDSKIALPSLRSMHSAEGRGVFFTANVVMRCRFFPGYRHAFLRPGHCRERHYIGLLLGGDGCSRRSDRSAWSDEGGVSLHVALDTWVEMSHWLMIQNTLGAGKVFRGGTGCFARMGLVRWDGGVYCARLLSLSVVRPLCELTEGSHGSHAT